MIRPAAQDELGFIRETCCKVRRPRGESWSTWEATHAPMVDAWLRDGLVLVYTDDQAPDIVLGFLVVTDGDLLRMLYVKKNFRGDGIGLALLGQLPAPPRAWQPNGIWRRWTEHHRRVLGSMAA